ncbi:hypothetical protein Hanom_Chr12g01158201 [Helianthus anomalus]
MVFFPRKLIVIIILPSIIGMSKAVLEDGVIIDIADETLAFTELIGSALVGRCKDLRILRNLNVILAENGCNGITLSYLGGLSMFLKFEDDVSCTDFMLEYQGWKDWFSSFEPWECQSLPLERFAWVKIHGVHLQLADNDVLNNIDEHSGKIVHGSNLEVEDEKLSVGWIALLVGEGGRIHDQVTLRWKNK